MSPQLRQTLDRALQLHQAGQYTEAEKQYRVVLSKEPNHADALHLLGLVLHKSDRNAAALIEIRKAVTLRGNTAEYHVSLTAVHLALGDIDAAITAGRRAVQLQPQLPQASFNLGNALSAKKQYVPAIECYRRAISLRPNYAQAHLGYGNALNDLHRHDEAITAYRLALSFNPRLSDAHYNLGNALRFKEQFEPAIAAYSAAVSLNPDHAEAINNMACILQHVGGTGRLDEAINSLMKVRAMHPNRAQVHSNLGNLLTDAHRWDEAMACYRQALVVQPEYHEARFNLALAMLATGDFERGWMEYETRWRCRGFPSMPRYMDKPLWLGEPLNGRRLLLHDEQGLGDTIQFVRFVPRVAGQFGPVILQVQQPLHRLLQNTPGASRVLSQNLAPDQFDLQCPLWSLPLALKTTLATIPPVAPGLYVDPLQRERWRHRLSSIVQPGHRLNVGLIWSGSPKFADNYRRSTRLARFAPLAGVPGVTFISLQKGPAAEQAADPPSGMRLIDWTNDLDDFADSAALISELDLVITTDTGAAHLAASLGKPTWILLMYAPDFRWMRDRPDSPWYPSARLFRQPVPGDWETPVMAMVDELKKL